MILSSEPNNERKIKLNALKFSKWALIALLIIWTSGVVLYYYVFVINCNPKEMDSKLIISTISLLVSFFVIIVNTLESVRKDEGSYYELSNRKK